MKKLLGFAFLAFAACAPIPVAPAIVTLVDGREYACTSLWIDDRDVYNCDTDHGRERFPEAAVKKILPP